ncbi:MAG: ABC transporter permease subunit [Phycisphaerales bacterium JB059]
MSRSSAKPDEHHGLGSKAPGSSSLRRTNARVRFWDRVAGVTITSGGLMVLAAMLGICVFLVASAAPLFRGGGAAAAHDARLEGGAVAPVLTRVGVRPSTAVILDQNGTMLEVGADSGRRLAGVDLTREGLAPAGVSYDPQAHEYTLVYADATIRSLEIEQPDLLLDPIFARDRWSSLEVGESAPLDEAQRREVARLLRLRTALTDHARIVRTKEETWQAQDFAVEQSDPATIPGVEERPAMIHAARASSRMRRMVCLTQSGRLYLVEARRVVRLGGGGSQERLRSAEVASGLDPEGVAGVFISSDGEDIFVVFADGRVDRYNGSEGVSGDIPRVESHRVTGEEDRVTCAQMALGGLSLIVGDSAGHASAWTVVDDPEGGGEDGRRLERTTHLRLGREAVTSIGVGERDRTVAFGLRDGRVELRNMTSGKRVAGLPATGEVPLNVAVAPALDRVVSVGDDGSLRTAKLEPGHPQASWRSLFGRVLYEGYNRPEFVYQSTGAQGVESKLSLTPLIWGTLKATMVAMLIAAPIAVLGAVFSSEFMHPRVRRTIKPTVEMMASLPSVVLGFVAAVLVAPYVRDWLPGILVAFAVVPLTVMAMAHAFRLAPIEWSRRLTSARLLIAVGVVLALSVTLSSLCGPLIERALFAPDRVDVALASGAFEPATEAPAWLAGRTELDLSQARRLRAEGLAIRDGALVRALPDQVEPGSPLAGAPSIRRWLDGAIGGAWPGWVVVLIFPMSVLVALVNARIVARPWSELVSHRPRRVGAVLELARFLLSVLVTIGLAIAGASALSALGFDPRDSIFGPFTQRNTLVVGLVMGFAVIPIIYTIADDAMRAVPNSLRSASLGAGATRWQTAVRVVLPVAGSGIFSACMIGLGRAVGETMIVLMATGNTPEMTLNIFSGFRTLAANIAVELPEAARGGTHYRVLFLCGLVLFAMTAIINTSAELVRQSFRKKNAAL